ncbi:MAG: NADH-quinone oxidoreductase subunit A [Gemmataceae bacterium]
MVSLVTTLLVFLVVGAVFVTAALLVGRLVRPNRPTPQKLEVYECGESPEGSSWIQFDLRFYVVALLFVIFDVELAFFFPWAVVFGSATRMADETQSPEVRLVAAQHIDPQVTAPPSPVVSHRFASFAFAEMGLFFAILLVGFAYLWSRGDLEWVRSLAGQETKEPQLSPKDMPSFR